MFDVRVMNERGVWITDSIEHKEWRALDRARFLLPRAPAVEVRHQATWKRLDLL